MPNVEDLNSNFSDSPDYLEIEEITSDVKTSDKSQNLASVPDATSSINSRMSKQDSSKTHHFNFRIYKPCNFDYWEEWSITSLESKQENYGSHDSQLDHHFICQFLEEKPDDHIIQSSQIVRSLCD